MVRLFKTLVDTRYHHSYSSNDCWNTLPLKDACKLAITGDIRGGSPFFPLMDECGDFGGLCVGVQFLKGMNERGSRISHFITDALACRLTPVSWSVFFFLVFLNLLPVFHYRDDGFRHFDTSSTHPLLLELYPFRHLIDLCEEKNDVRGAEGGFQYTLYIETIKRSRIQRRSSWTYITSGLD